MADAVIDTLTNGYVIALTLLVIWTVMVYYLRKTGFLEKHKMSNWGPFLMWRTQGGKSIIEKLSKPKRFWNLYAAVANGIVVLAMFSMLALLIWEAALVDQIPAESAPTPEMILGIPGINPLIPIWYGILGLIVAIVVHEFAHGILTRVGGMAIKALGLVFAIIPMGAFVEPDEDALRTTTRRKRMFVFAVGPATNIIVAFIFAILFSSVMVSSVTATSSGPVVLGTVDDSPAALQEIGYGSQVISFNGISINSVDGWRSVDADVAGSTSTLSYNYKGETITVDVFSGVTLMALTKGYPAYDAGMEVGMLFYSLNDTLIHNDDDLKGVLESTVPGQTINVTMLQYDAASESYEVVPGITNVTLESKRDYYVENGISIEDDFKDIGFMGINSAFLGLSVQDPEKVQQQLAEPYHDVDGFGGFVQKSLTFIALPFYGLAPMQSPLSDIFEPTGVFAFLGTDGFWILANCCYWIFWINLMVGLTNALPAVPLDGGYIFRDGMDSLLERFGKKLSLEQREKVINQITMGLAIFILFLLIWQFLGPRLV